MTKRGGDTARKRRRAQEEEAPPVNDAQSAHEPAKKTKLNKGGKLSFGTWHRFC